MRRQEIEVIGEDAIQKEVGRKSKEENDGQVYVKKEWIGQPCLVFWNPQNVRRSQVGDAVLIKAEVDGFDQREPYKRGNVGGFFAHGRYIGKDALVVLDPRTFTWTSLNDE